jgi:uncharacterized protein YcnI
MGRGISHRRERARKRALPVVVAAGLMGVYAQSAYGHAVVQPSASRPAEQQVYTLTVPSERSSDVISVSLQVPAEVESLIVREAPGWNVRLQKDGDRVAVVRWSGNRIPPSQYDSFQFIARNPVTEGTLDWKVIQQYTNATDRWIGPPDSENPAARTTITESATPVDAINTESGAPTAAAGATGAGGDTAAAAGTAAKSDEDSDALPLVLGGVALVAALAALGVALTGRRRRT